MTLENGRLIIDLTGSLLTLLIIGFWVAVGWNQGFRYIVTIAIFVTLGYLLTVRAEVIVCFLLLAIGVGWKGPWETRLPGWQGFQQMRLLGAFTGFYIGILMISAI